MVNHVAAFVCYATIFTCSLLAVNTVESLNSEHFQENVNSSEDLSAKTKSVIELKKLQLLPLQRRVRRFIQFLLWLLVDGSFDF